MRAETRYDLDKHEQKALIESAADSPLDEIQDGSVTATSWAEGKVLVQWAGMAIIPLAQLEAVVATVAQEREGR